MRDPAAARPPLPAILAFIAVPVLFHVVIVETQHIHFSLTPNIGMLFKLGFVTASALTHWAIYAGLFLTFAATLRRGKEPLITMLARKMHGGMNEERQRYTRKVTIAWCCFFAMQLGLSVSLFCFAPLVVWSFFVNILDIPLVAAMFAAEYVCRRLCLEDPPRDSIGAIFNMVATLRKPGQETASSL